MKAKCLFFDPSLINFINDDGNGVITGNVAGRAEGILSDVKGNHEGADRAVGVTQLFTKDHPKERQGRHDGAARSTRRSNHGNAEGHDERNNRAQMDRNLVHEADCRGTGCDGDHGTAHMDVGAKRNDEVTDLFADTVGLGAFQVDRNGGGRRLGPQCGGIARNLVLHEHEGVLVADGAGNHELNEEQDEVHGDDHKEDFPQNAQDNKGFARFGHIDEGSADIKRKERDDGMGQNSVDDAGKVLYSTIEGVTNGFAFKGGQGQTQDEGEHNSGNRVKDRWNGNGKERFESNACDLGKLFRNIAANERRKRLSATKKRTCRQ